MSDTNDHCESFGARLMTQTDRDGTIGELAAAAKADAKFPRQRAPDDVQATADNAETDWLSY